MPEQTYERALQRAKITFSELSPMKAAVQAHVLYHSLTEGRGEFQVLFWGRVYRVYWPDGTVYPVEKTEEADVVTRILLLHYLLTADGTPLADRWIAFRNLPGGLGYDEAFQRRAEHRLVQVFGQDPRAFEAAAQALGGERLNFGDVSFAFRILPRVWLAVVLYVADEEFPASANVLFDAAAGHYLPTEDLAVLGGMLAGRLVKAAPQTNAASTR
ncbi:MAG: DUF3786 domain-containing protein [Anaerolineae bacterium]